MSGREEGDSYRLAKVGTFVAIALIALVVVIGLLGRSRSLLSSKALLHTSFDNISGLVVGAPVRLAGVDIGIVQKIQFDRDPKVKKVHVVLGVQSRYLDRVREQVYLLNLSAGWIRYVGRVILKDIPGRVLAKKIENDYIHAYLKTHGSHPRGNPPRRKSKFDPPFLTNV